MKFAHALAVPALLAFAQPAAAATNIVVNPSFEAGVNGTVSAGWTFSQQMGIYTTEVGMSRTGSGHARANCVGAACVSTFDQGAYFEQDLVTVPGQYYDFSVWITEAGDNDSAYSVFWGGQLVSLVANPNKNGVYRSIGSVDFPGYKQFFVNGLLATGALTNLQVHGRQDSNSIYFDDVSVTEAVGAVPEPATWMSLLLGFFGIGAALRRRRRNGAALTA